jgi:hypothetical protein
VRPEHEPREVDLPAMRRRIRTVIEAKLALITEIGDAFQISGIQFFRFAVNLVAIQPLKEVVERGTQIVATPTPITDIEDALEFAFDV